MTRPLRISRENIWGWGNVEIQLFFRRNNWLEVSRSLGSKSYSKDQTASSYPSEVFHIVFK